MRSKLLSSTDFTSLQPHPADGDPLLEYHVYDRDNRLVAGFSPSYFSPDAFDRFKRKVEADGGRLELHID